jgi:high-affinity Fe2+/Pb2+ permease
LVKAGDKLQGIGSIAMAVAMIAAFLLVLGGVKLASSRQTRGKGILMIVAALVIVMNVMIWTA